MAGVGLGSGGGVPVALEEAVPEEDAPEEAAIVLALAGAALVEAVLAGAGAAGVVIAVDGTYGAEPAGGCTNRVLAGYCCGGNCRPP